SNNFYKYPALLPVMTWKDSIAPLPPVNLRCSSDSLGASARASASIREIGNTDHFEDIVLSWKKPKPASDGDTASYYAVYRFSGLEELDLGNPQNLIGVLGADKNYFIDEAVPGQEYIYAVTSLDRLQNESEPVFIRVNYTLE
ncbi:MAG: hypothetical protein R6W90_17675, partial [Ignavibacteriaceae bacterium]